MPPFRRIADIGEVYVPHQFREVAAENASWKIFTNSELGQFNRIFTHLRRGGVAILSGNWGQVTEVVEYIERKKEELIQPAHAGRRDRKRSSRNKNRWQRQEEADRRGSDAGLAPLNPAKERERALSRLMCWADPAGTLQVTPPPNLPYLLEWIGENQGANEGQPFLVPIVKIQKIQRALAETYPIRALRMSLVTSENVLPPHSQETIELFQHGLQSVKPNLPTVQPNSARYGLWVWVSYTARGTGGGGFGSKNLRLGSAARSSCNNPPQPPTFCRCAQQSTENPSYASRRPLPAAIGALFRSDYFQRTVGSLTGTEPSRNRHPRRKTTDPSTFFRRPPKLPQPKRSSAHRVCGCFRRESYRAPRRAD